MIVSLVPRPAPPASISLGFAHTGGGGARGGCGRVRTGREAEAGRLLDRLLRSDSAARLLLDWCEERRIGEGPVRAVPGVGAGEAVPPDLLDYLDARAGDVVRHRRTVMIRGEVGLADFDLWWLPGRLPPMLGEALDATDHPFGLVVAPLRPRRRTVFAEMPAGRCLVEHHVVVEVPGVGEVRPVAAVRERYRAALSRLG